MSRCETVMQVVAKLLLMSSKMHLCYSLLHIAILYEQYVFRLLLTFVLLEKCYLILPFQYCS